MKSFFSSKYLTIDDILFILLIVHLINDIEPLDRAFLILRNETTETHELMIEMINDR